MADVVAALGWCEELDRRGHQGEDLIETPRLCRTEKGFQFCERKFNGIEVRTVRWQEPEVRARGLDRDTHLRLFVHREVVQDHDIAAAERGHQHLFDIRKKARAVDGPIKDRGRGEAVPAEPHDHGVGLPVATRRVIAESRAPATAAVAPDQVGRHATLVEEHVLLHIAERQPGAPTAPLSDDVGPPLFVRVYGFF